MRMDAKSRYIFIFNFNKLILLKVKHHNFRKSLKKTKNKEKTIMFIIYCFIIISIQLLLIMIKLIRPYLLRLATFNTIPKLNLITLSPVVTIKTYSQKQTHLQNNDYVMKKYQSKDRLPQYLSQNIKKSMLNYPYIYIPLALIDNYSEVDASKEQLKDLIAFRCLKNITQEQLKKAYEILSPSVINLKKINANQFDVGRQMFTQHFNNKNQTLKNALKGQGNIEQKLKYLIVLNHYKLNNSTTELVKQISERQLLQWDKTGVGLSIYIQLLIKNNLSFKHLIGKIEEKLSNPYIQKSYKLKIATSIITIPRFNKSFSQEFIDYLLSIINKQVYNLNNFQLLQILKLIYSYTSVQSISLCKNVLKLIQQIDINQHPQRAQFFVPLLLKTLKYAGVINIRTEQTIFILYDNTDKFLPIFQSISKRHYQTLILLWNNQKISQDLLQKIKTHLTTFINFYAESNQEIQQQELVKFYNLCLKNWNKLGTDIKIIIKQNILKILQTQTEKISIIYECLLIILQQKDKLIQKQNNKTIIRRFTKLFFDSTCARNNLGQLLVKSHLQQNILLASLIVKNELSYIESIPQIQRYSFENMKYLQQNILDKLFQYLNILDSSKQPQIYRNMIHLQPLVMIHLNNKGLPFKTTLLIIQVCSKCNYHQKKFFLRMQKNIFQMLKKFQSFKLSKDLHVLKDHMVQHNLGSKGFQQLVLEALQKPNNWEQLKKKYVANENAYWRKIDQNIKQRRQRSRQ